MTAEALKSQPYEDAERATLRLHELMRSGLDDSAEAEQLRGFLYGPWEQMTPAQREFAAGLSADLYMLHPDDGEVLEPASDEERSPQRLGLQIKAAWDRHDWVGALALLRKGPSFFPPGHVAYLRARAYDELGRPAVSLAFIQHARTLDGANATYAILEVAYLRAVGRRAEALTLAHTYVDSAAGRAAKVVVYAAGVVFDSTRNLGGAEAQVTLRRLADALRGVMVSAMTESPASYLSGLVILAACLDGLGELNSALDVYRWALRQRQFAGSEDWATYAALEGYVAARFRPTAAGGRPAEPQPDVLFAIASTVTHSVAAA